MIWMLLGVLAMPLWPLNAKEGGSFEVAAAA